MNHLQKRILSILAAAAMTCSALPQSAALPLLQPVLTASAADSVYRNFAYTENENGSITITKYNGNDEIVEIPDQINDKPVTEIKGWAFFQNHTMTNVLIPNSITVINSNAFNQCIALKEVALPGDLTEIADNVFTGCTALTRVIMPGGVTRIGSAAFAGCTNLIDIDIPESVTEIGFNAFSDTAWLAEKQEQNPLVIVNHILIDGTACKGNVSVPDGVTSIGGNAFYGCKDLERIYIPLSVESIGNDAFYDCTGLMCINFVSILTTENRLKTIGGNAFYNCQKLEEITLPDSVTDIGTATFFGCTNLRNVHLPEKLTDIKSGRQGVFQGCSSLSEITIPGSVSNIGQMAFAMCSNLNKAYIQGINTTIGGGAFYGCPSNLSLWGYAGSSAQEYAANNSINFAELTAKFSGVSLTLTDDLGLNFFAKGVNAANSEYYHVVFSGKCEEAGQEIKFTEKGGKFCATANVAAPNMGEYVGAILERFNGESWEEVDTYLCSVNGYLGGAKPEEGWSEEKTEAFRKLVKTVKRYGEVSHAYFNDPENMPEVTDHYDDLRYGNGECFFNGYAKYVTNNPLEDYYDTEDTDLISLTLNSRLSMRLYLDGLTEGDEGQLKVIDSYGNHTFDYTPIPAKTSRFGSYFEITDISPLRLDTLREIRYNGFTYQFTPLTWCYRVMANYDEPRNYVMANTLYEYYIDATAFSEAN